MSSALRQFQDATQSINMWKMTPQQRTEFYAQNQEIVAKMSEDCQTAKEAREKAEREARAERAREDAKRKAAVRHE
jgi:hypothetical protein